MPDVKREIGSVSGLRRIRKLFFLFFFFAAAKGEYWAQARRVGAMSGYLTV